MRERLALLLVLSSPSAWSRTNHTPARVVRATKDNLPHLQRLFRQAQVSYPPRHLLIRVFKHERQLELWAPGADARYRQITTYPICSASGVLGPKRRQGDLQVPEGFYRVNVFNPFSAYHLSLGIDYPNASDRVRGHRSNLGGAIMIHGDCVSIGCVAITNGPASEVYLAAAAAWRRGRRPIPVHIFPTRLDAAGMERLTRRYAGRKELLQFWAELRSGFEHFDRHRTLPPIRVDRAGHYHVVINQQALDNSASEAVRAEAALAAARANAAAVKQDIARVDAEARGLGNLRQNLRLVSPADGVIVSREAEPGTTVVAGQAVLRLIVPQSLWVRARIDQSRAQGVQVGQRATIMLRSTPDTPMPGRVARIELQSDPVTEERVVNVSFDAPPARLYLGELAEVTIRLPGKAGVLVIPSAAIAREGSQTGVWQVAQKRAHFKPVTMGSQGQAGVTEILSGLSQGERVIVYSAAQLKPGARVREQKVEQR